MAVEPMAVPRGFVRVCRSDPTRLEEPDGTPCFFAGANCYYLLVRACKQVA